MAGRAQRRPRHDHLLPALRPPEHDRPGEIGTRCCWSCRTLLTLPPVIQVTTANPPLTRTIALTPGAGYSPITSARPAPPRFHRRRGRRSGSRTSARAGRLGLKNLTGNAWTARRSDGSSDDVPPGRSIDITVETRLQFGAAEAVIRRLGTT